MKLLYGTKNPAKLAAMRNQLKDLPIEIVGLADLKLPIPKVVEDGTTLLENAGKKAKTYYEAFNMPVLACDTGLYFENLPENLQPHTHVRRVQGNYLTDEEMKTYYGSLAERYGALRAYYRHGICLIMDKDHIWEREDASTESERFLLSPEASRRIEKPGFPLDSMSVDLETGMHFYDVSEEKLEKLAVPAALKDIVLAAGKAFEAGTHGGNSEKG